MKGDFNLRYIKSKKLNPSANSDRAIVLRQQYAIQIFKLLNHKKRVINVDETWLNETSFTRKAWAKNKGQGNTRLNVVSPRISMIAALDTDGKVWFTLAQANTDSNMMALFLYSLTK